MELKFRTKEEGILKINDLLLKGYEKEDIREALGIELTKRTGISTFTGEPYTWNEYSYNGKTASQHSGEWHWREKLLIDMLGE